MNSLMDKDISHIMYNSPATPKLKMGPVFKTPMTYSPYMRGDKHVPSPSRIELWKDELGLNDDPDAGRCTSESDTEAMETLPTTPGRSTCMGNVLSPKSPCTFVEYQTLKKELEERNSQRDELFYNIRTWMEKTKQYKKRLEKEETTRRQQVKILRKTHTIHLEEKDRLIQNLEDVVEESEAKIKELEARLQDGGKSGQFSPRSPSSRSSIKLVEEVKRLQSEKSELTHSLDSIQSELELLQKEKDMEVTSLNDRIAQLQKEKNDYVQEINKLKNLVQNSDTGPCSTDNEKQIDKLQLENDKLIHQVADLRHTLKTNSSQSYMEQLHKANDANQKLQKHLNQMEEEMITKSEEHDRAVAKLKSENLKMLKEKQFVTQQMREMRAEVVSLQAKEPEVVTKIRRVEVEVDSDNLKRSYREAQVANEMLGDQIRSLEGMCGDLRYQLTDSVSKNSSLEKQVIDFTSEIVEVNRQMAEEIGDLEHRKEEAVVATKKEMELKFRSLRTNYEKLRLKLSLVHPLLLEVTDSYHLLRKECYLFPKLLQTSIDTVKHEVCSAISEISNNNKDLVRKYRQEMALRKKFHNELVELKGNIRVFCRVRPRTKEDNAQPLRDIVVTFDPDDDMVMQVTNKGRKNVFDLDKVFREDSTQTEVFEEVKSLVTSCLDGFNVCIFAFGQTGSGKTYTMEGPKGNEGINQRALRELFDEIGRQHQDWTYTLSVSVMEIYNEAVRDLLSNDPSYKLDVKMSSEGGYHVPGLTSVKVENVSDVNTVFSIGQRNRATATTNMNEHSSRSHALLCITVVGVNKSTQTVTTGKLNLVDLAGSERVSKSGADGARLREAQNINKSLASLGDVIHALRTKQNFVPYRNSKLTYLLQDSLKGDSKTLMIVQVAPTERHVSETLCSLNFAQRVRNVELGTATKRVEACDTENIPSAMNPQSPQRSLMKMSSCSALSPSNRGLSQSNSISVSRVAQIIGSKPGKGNSPSSKKSPSSAKNTLSRAVTPLLKPIRKRLNINP